MVNNEDMIKKLKVNIAIYNFKTELNSNEKERALKNKFWRLYEMKIKIAVILTTIILLVSGSVLAFEIFSSIDGDDLSISATYDGDGIVSIYVENKSNKVLEFQKKIKLMRWSNSEEIKTISDKIEMSNTKISPNSSGIVKLDISKMYDLNEIEEPITEEGDYYYFVLTNNNFIFGSDWQCSIDFNKDNNIKKSEIVYLDKVQLESEMTEKNSNLNNTYDESANSDYSNDINTKFNEELKSYYEEWIINPNERNQKVVEYYKKVYELLKIERENGKNIISSVDPWLFVGKPDESVIFDNRVDKQLQYQLIVENHHTLDAFNIPVGSSDFDNCIVLSTTVPKRLNDINSTSGEAIPLIYIFQYDIKELKKEDTYVFIRGKLYNYDELDKYKVYQDDEYVSYNVTEMFYSDLEIYVDTYTKNRNDIFIDDGVKLRIRNIYDYYMNKENLGKSFYYHE